MISRLANTIAFVARSSPFVLVPTLGATTGKADCAPGPDTLARPHAVLDVSPLGTQTAMVDDDFLHEN